MPIRILFPVDKRLGSIRTLNFLIANKEIYNPVVNLVHVLDFSQLEWHGIIPEYQEQIKETATKVSETLVQEFKEKLEKNDIYVENTIILEGEAGKAICEEADRLNVDLITVSPNNKSEITNVIFGSVTHYVIHNSNCPVLIVK